MVDKNLDEKDSKSFNTHKIIQEYICQELLDGQSVTDSDDLLLSGLVDSMGVMQLVSFIEQAFSIQIPPEDVIIENMLSINVITHYVELKLQNLGINLT